MRNVFFPIFFFCIHCSLFAQEMPDYKNPAIDIDIRVEDLLKRMTLDEKVAQLRHLHNTQAFDGQQLNLDKLRHESKGLSWGFIEGFQLTSDNCKAHFRNLQKYFVDETRLGIPALIVAETLHGVVHEGATVYPQNVALGSTFNPSLAKEKTKKISEELHFLGVNQVLSPCIDVIRELRWGRAEESYGEDPLLCGLMGLNEVQGYLDSHISPMLKHFGPHGNPRGGLNLASADCGLGELHDIYLKPFEMIVKSTDLRAIMSCYSSWNRIPNSASKHLLQDILRDQWGYKGFVYSDWGAIRMLKNFHFIASTDEEATLQAFGNGLDVEASSTCYPSLVDLVNKKIISEDKLNMSVRRVLRLKFELGLFDDPYRKSSCFAKSFHDKSAVELSKRIADESIVLLKNDENLLPLNINSIKSLAIIGPNADEVQVGDYTWAGEKKDGVTPLQAIKEYCGKKIDVYYAQGCMISSPDTSGIQKAVEQVKKSDLAVLFLGNSSCRFARETKNHPTSGEGFDMHDLSLTGAQSQLLHEVYKVGKPTVVVLVTGKPIAIPWVKENIPSILVQWYGGEMAGKSISDVLFGVVNPSGKLPLSFPQSTGHLPCFYNHLPSDKGFYQNHGSIDKPGMDYVFSSPKPLWSFGYGMSYTDIQITNACINKSLFNRNDSIQLAVSLTNKGKRSGKEVVQVYFRDCFSSSATPVQRLCAFEKIALQPDETKQVIIQVPIRNLSFTDNNEINRLEDGAFELQIGNSSDNITKTFMIGIGDKGYVQSQIDSYLQFTPQLHFHQIKN